ncbi:unnamed protein product [Arctogadus glacialis]
MSPAGTLLQTLPSPPKTLRDPLRLWYMDLLRYPPSPSPPNLPLDRDCPTRRREAHTTSSCSLGEGGGLLVFDFMKRLPGLCSLVVWREDVVNTTTMNGLSEPGVPEQSLVV